MTMSTPVPAVGECLCAQFGLTRLFVSKFKREDATCPVRIEHRNNGKNDWETPPGLFKKLDEEFHFTLDVCADAQTAKCEYFYDEVSNGLVQDWSNVHSYMSKTLRGRLAWPAYPTCWMNPPYNNWQEWVKKAKNEAVCGATVVALLPARTDTKIFHSCIWDITRNAPYPDVELRFIPGRIKFVGAKHGAPFPSMIVIFRPQRRTNEQ